MNKFYNFKRSINKVDIDIDELLFVYLCTKETKSTVDYCISLEFKDGRKVDICYENADTRAVDYNEFLLATNEEKLKNKGVDLNTLHKALINGIYYKCDNQILNQKQVILCSDYDTDRFILRAPSTDLFGDYWYVDEYGKTWATNKEELKDE